MSDLTELAQLASEESYLKALLDTVGDRLKTVRADMQEALDASPSIKQVAATLPNGVEVAKICLTDPKPEAVVTDPEAFLAWVREAAPSEVVRRVEVITEIRPAYRAAVLAQMTAVGRPEVCDKETGVIDSVPGVEVKATRARGHSVRFSKTGKEAVAAAWQAGQLTAVVLPELPPAEPEPIRCSRCEDVDGPFTGASPDDLCDACARPIP